MTDRDDIVIAMLRTLTAEVSALRADIRRPRGSAASRRAEMVELVAAIHEAAKHWPAGGIFASREAVKHAYAVPAAWRLRLAVAKVVGDKSPARALGWALSTWEGIPLDGLQVRCVGGERAGKLWKVETVAA